jgi:hypothetical protein
MPLSLHCTACRRAAVLAGLLTLLAITASAATLHLTGPDGAMVRLDGQDLGPLPLAGPLTLPAGVYELECRARGYKPLTETVTLAEPESWLLLRLRPVPLERSQAVASSLLYAGLGQWYNGAKLRGWVYFAGETGGLLTALAGELQRQNHRDDYLNAKARYDAALLPEDLALWRARTERSYQDLKDMESLRNTGLYVAAGAWALSLLDAWLLFPGADIGPGLVPPGPQASLASDARRAGSGGQSTGIHARIRFAF